MYQEMQKGRQLITQSFPEYFFLFGGICWHRMGLIERLDQN